MKIDLLTGTSKRFHVPGDNLRAGLQFQLLDKLTSFEPLVESTGNLIAKLDTLYKKLNSLFTSEFRSILWIGAGNLESAGNELKMILKENRQEINESDY